MTCHSKLKDLQGYLKSHDWYHNYSDDYKVWKHGTRISHMMRNLSKELIDEGYKDEVILMWKENAPEGYENGWK